MSQSRHDQRTLRDTADNLARSDPSLASMLTLFTQLATGEPVPRQTQARPPRGLGSLAARAARCSRFLLRRATTDAAVSPLDLQSPGPRRHH